jgi:hypothetical protein
MQDAVAPPTFVSLFIGSFPGQLPLISIVFLELLQQGGFLLCDLRAVPLVRPFLVALPHLGYRTAARPALALPAFPHLPHVCFLHSLISARLVIVVSRSGATCFTCSLSPYCVICTAFDNSQHLSRRPCSMRLRDRRPSPQDSISCSCWRYAR